MPLLLDTRFLAEYPGHPGFWHERCILHHVHSSHYISMSADGDIYMENYAPDAWISIHKLKTDRLGSRVIPTGIDPGDCLWFEEGSAGLLTPLSESQIAAALAQAKEMLLECRAELGLQVPVRRVRGKTSGLPGGAQPLALERPAMVNPGAKVGGPPRPDIGTPFAGRVPPAVYPRPDPLDTTGRWRYLISGVGFAKGGDAHISGDFLFNGRFGVTTVSPGVTAPVEYGQASEVAAEIGDLDLELAGKVQPVSKDQMDVRLLEYKEDRRGKRHFPFKEAADILQEPSEEVSLVDGPSTICFCASYMAGNGGTPLNYHSRFVQEGGLDKADPYVIEHEAYCRILQYAMEIDQIHVSQCVSFELVCRGLQRIQMRYRECFLGKIEVDNNSGKKGKGRSRGNPDLDLHLFLGSSPLRGRMCIAPALLEWISERKHREYMLLKEERKLNEERFALQSGGKPPPDKA